MHGKVKINGNEKYAETDNNQDIMRRSLFMNFLIHFLVNTVVIYIQAILLELLVSCCLAWIASHLALAECQGT